MKKILKKAIEQKLDMLKICYKSDMSKRRLEVNIFERKWMHFHWSQAFLI